MRRPSSLHKREPSDIYTPCPHCGQLFKHRGLPQHIDGRMKFEMWLIEARKDVGIAVRPEEIKHL